MTQTSNIGDVVVLVLAIGAFVSAVVLTMLTLKAVAKGEEAHQSEMRAHARIVKAMEERQALLARAMSRTPEEISDDSQKGASRHG